MRPSHYMLILAFGLGTVGAFTLSVADHPSLLGCYGIICIACGIVLAAAGGVESAIEEHMRNL